MNFKTLVLAAMAFTTISAQAKFFTPIHNYILGSGKVVMLQGIKVSRGTAWYYDNDLNKRVSVNLSEVSKETKEKINGVKEDDFVYTTTKAGPQICIAYYVFENGMASLGCRTGKILDYYGPAKYQVATYSGSTKNLLAPVNEVDGYSKGETAILDGQKVLIRAIYSNGYVLTETAFILSHIDTSSALSNASIQIVTTRDLQKL